MSKQIVVGLLLLFGVLFLFHNGNLDDTLGIISNKLFENQNNITQKIPTPTPELPISCNIGKFSLDLPRKRCDSLQGYIEAEKQIDISIVQQLINSLSAQIQKLNTPSNSTNQSDFKGQLENVLEGCTGNESEAYRCKLNTLGSLAQIFGQEYQRQRELESQLQGQLTKYKNYLFKIQVGGVSNGACMNHEGVDCSTPRGNIGQVVCADGWDQSQVYYFNIKECVEYAESTLSQ